MSQNCTVTIIFSRCNHCQTQLANGTLLRSPNQLGGPLGLCCQPTPFAHPPPNLDFHETRLTEAGARWHHAFGDRHVRERRAHSSDSARHTYRGDGAHAWRSGRGQAKGAGRTHFRLCHSSSLRAWPLPLPPLPMLRDRLKAEPFPPGKTHYRRHRLPPRPRLLRRRRISPDSRGRSSRRWSLRRRRRWGHR